jgi:hypothetical protein
VAKKERIFASNSARAASVCLFAPGRQFTPFACQDLPARP